jgi:hypothetical protein
VTAGATAQLSSAFVERLATGTVAAVLAIGGLSLGTDTGVLENPRNKTIGRKHHGSGSLHVRIKNVEKRAGNSTTAVASTDAAPAAPSDVSESLAVGVSGELPTTDDDDGSGGGRTIDLGPTATGEEPVDEAMREAVDLANDTLEAGNGTTR